MGYTRLKGASSAAPIAREKDFYYLLYTLPVSGYDLVTRATREYTPGALTFPSVSVKCVCVCVCVYTARSSASGEI